MAPFPEHDPEWAGHTKPAMEWTVDELIQWIDEKEKDQLDEDERTKLRKKRVTGRIFLSRNGNEDFFDRCGLSLGTAVVLAELSGELAAKEKSAEIKKKIEQAESMDMSDPASKGSYLGRDYNLQLAGNAIRQRKLVRQKIEELNQQPIDPPAEDAILPPGDAVLRPEDAVLRPEDAVPRPEDVIPYSNSVAKLSDPNFYAKLPFPFVGSTVPNRFDFDRGNAERNWSYMGREKFKELVAKFNDIYGDDTHTNIIVYGTRGYGKSHLLAAFVCLLAAAETKVVYLPDCRAFVANPIKYMRAAMLFAWADDKDKQLAILKLNNQEEMSEFLISHSKEVIYIIDQLNALEEEKDDQQVTKKKKAQLSEWLGELVMEAKGILSSSANNHKILGGVNRQDYSKIMYTYGGLTTTEMECWWERKEKMELVNNKFTDDKKSKVEDLTGRIPLFLKECIVNNDVNLKTQFFEGLCKD